jgi:hypothetical protein
MKETADSAGNPFGAQGRHREQKKEAACFRRPAGLARLFEDGEAACAHDAELGSSIV